MRRLAGFVIAALLCALPLIAQSGAKNGEWRSYAGEEASTGYSPLDQINRENVANLRPVWRRPAIDPLLMAKFPDLVASDYFRGTPIIIDDEAAQCTYDQVGGHFAGWFSFQPLYDKIVADCPDLLN